KTSPKFRPWPGAPRDKRHRERTCCGLDIKRANAVREQHDRENEPGRALADHLFRIATHVVGGGAEVREDNRRRTPKGDESKQDGGGDKYFDRWPTIVWGT